MHVQFGMSDSDLTLQQVLVGLHTASTRHVRHVRQVTEASCAKLQVARALKYDHVYQQHALGTAAVSMQKQM
jgi:hypothetical protein